MFICYSCELCSCWCGGPSSWCPPPWLITLSVSSSMRFPALWWRGTWWRHSICGWVFRSLSLCKMFGCGSLYFLYLLQEEASLMKGSWTRPWSVRTAEHHWESFDLCIFSFLKDQCHYSFYDIIVLLEESSFKTDLHRRNFRWGRIDS